jgi:hypothetical protein
MSRYLLIVITISDICWLRLDFESMTIAGPADTLETTGGTCKDTFKIVVSIAVVVFVAIAAVDAAFAVGVAIAIVVIIIAFAVCCYYCCCCCCLVKLIILKNVDFRLNHLFLQSSANQVVPTICGVNTGQHSKFYNLTSNVIILRTS